MVIDTRAWFEDDVIACAVNPKSQVHIFEISAKRSRKRSDSQQHFPPIEGAASAGPEDATRLKINGRQGLAVTALTGHASEIIAIAGAIDLQLAVERN
jgi:hypothetical protein